MHLLAPLYGLLMIVAHCWKACCRNAKTDEDEEDGATDQDDEVSDLIAVICGFPILHTPKLSVPYVCTISLAWFCVFYCMVLRVVAFQHEYAVSSFEQFAMLTYYTFISIIASIWSGWVWGD